MAAGLPKLSPPCSFPDKPPLRGPALGDAALMSRREPLAGPGPLGPAETGTPVSATVGVTAGRLTTGSEATIGTGAAGLEIPALGMGAGV